MKHWKDFFETGDQKPPIENENIKNEFQQSAPDSYLDSNPPLKVAEDADLIQLFNTYILIPSVNSFLLIHQQSAHERIIYERLQEAAKGKPVAVQRNMFPVTIELAPADTAVMNEIMNDLQQLGYIIESFGKNTFVVQGTPADVNQGNEKQVIDSLLEQYKYFSSEMKFSKREKLVRSLAWQQSVKPGVSLSESEMRSLAEDLFQCSSPNITPNGNPTYLEFKKDHLEKMFGRG